MTDSKLLNVDESVRYRFVVNDCTDVICSMLCYGDPSHREADETEICDFP